MSEASSSPPANPSAPPLFSSEALPAVKALAVERIAAEYGRASGAFETSNLGQRYNAFSLRDNCVAFRKGVQSAVEAVYGSQAFVTGKVTALTAPTPAMLSYKETVLDLRRNYKAPLVAAVAVLSVMSAVGAPGRLEKLRIAARNLFLFGGGGAVLLYPEFAFLSADLAHSKANSTLVKRDA